LPSLEELRAAPPKPRPEQSTGKLCLKCLLRRADRSQLQHRGIFSDTRLSTGWSDQDRVDSSIFTDPADVKCRDCGHNLSTVSLDDLFSYTCWRCDKKIRFSLIGHTLHDRCARCGQKWKYADWRQAVKKKYSLGFFV
jgi:DNA-directed RNA polymerase subunit RPC12/RpoP